MIENKLNQKKKPKYDDINGYEADMMDIERKYPSLKDINTSKGMYDESIFSGINRNQSIFDKQAIFHTRGDQ